MMKILKIKVNNNNNLKKQNQELEDMLQEDTKIFLKISIKRIIIIMETIMISYQVIIMGRNSEMEVKRDELGGK